MTYKGFKVNYDFQIDTEINLRVSQGYEFVQVLMATNAGSTEHYTVLMRKPNDATHELANTLRKTVENIKSDPSNPVNVALTDILLKFRDGLNKTA